MASRFVLDDEISSLSAGELCGPRLLGIEMVEAGLARDNFPVFGNL